MFRFIRDGVVGLLILLVVAFSIGMLVNGWPFPALCVLVVGLLLGWAWIDNRFIYFGRTNRPGGVWRGSAPHEGWLERSSDTDAWLGGQ